MRGCPRFACCRVSSSYVKGLTDNYLLTANVAEVDPSSTEEPIMLAHVPNMEDTKRDADVNDAQGTCQKHVVAAVPGQYNLRQQSQKTMRTHAAFHGMPPSSVSIKLWMVGR